MGTTQTATLEHLGLLHAAGADARAFLHGQLTNDIEHLPAGQARLAGWCSAQGRLLATFLVIPYSGGFLLQLSADLVAPVAKRLSMFVLRAKVKIADATGEWRQYGQWREGGGTLEVAEADGAVTVGIEPGRALLLVPASSAAQLQADASSEAWQTAEIRAGRPLVTQATQDQFVPQMLNLELAGGVDFRKGCYPGQEVVARAQYRGAVKRRMVRLRAPGLRAGQELFSDALPGQPSGSVVNAAGGEALAVVQLAALEASSPLRAQAGGDPIEILPLPYA